MHVCVCVRVSFQSLFGVAMGFHFDGAPLAHGNELSSQYSLVAVAIGIRVSFALDLSPKH